MQQNVHNPASQPPFSPSSAPHHNTLDSSLSFGLDPYTAKQMAALQATSLAKAGNRSAPGGTSVPIFGGMSMNQSNSFSRTDPAAQDITSHHPLSGSSDHQASNQLPNPQLSQINSAAAQLMQRKRSFLNGLANVMNQRNTPLPPSLTGVPNPPGFDPSTSHWKALEVSSTDFGVIRLAGKDVDLYRLWALVFQAGGGAKVTQQNMWPHVMPQFDLPEHFPVPQPSGQTSVAAALANYYMNIIGPFEEAYRKNMRDRDQQQQRAMLAGRGNAGAQQPPPGSSQGRPGSMGGFPAQGGPVAGPQGNAANMNVTAMGQPIHTNQVQNLDAPLMSAGAGQFSMQQNMPHAVQLSQQPSSSGLNIPDARRNITPIPDTLLNTPTSSQRPLSRASGPPPAFAIGQDSGTSEFDSDADNRKRKMRESEDPEAKRVRQKTGGSEASDSRSSVGLDRGSVPPPNMTAAHSAYPSTHVGTPLRAQRQPLRRKIEYIPLAREIDTAGGRDLATIQNEFLRASHRPFKDINDWGHVDVEALILSLRSRISTELSYALTTFTLLTLMRGPQKDLGFPITQCTDLLEEAIDLLEDISFKEADDLSTDDLPQHVTTYRELTNAIVEDGHRPFAALDPKQGSRNSDWGPKPRPADIILATTNIIRNLSNIPENHDYMAKHDRLFSICLRLCCLKHSEDSFPAPLSPVLSLSDLLTVRKDIVYMLVNLAGYISFPSPSEPSPQTKCNAVRAFELLSSYFVDPVEAVSPFGIIMMTGVAPALSQPKPPVLVDAALEVFTRLALPDDTRQVFSKVIPTAWQWDAMEALVHRLPLADPDFQVLMRDTWLGYIEKVLLAMYTLAFLASPQLKKRIKTDRSLGFTKVVLRLAKKLLTSQSQEIRAYFVIPVRRAIEVMRLIDDAEDPFDTSQSTTPMLTFGVGHGEFKETRMEKGMGLLSGNQEDIIWSLMMQRETDRVMFEELESLIRIG